MLLLLSFIACITTGAKVNTTVVSSSGSNIHHDSLVGGVEETLGVCTSIVQEVRDFRDGLITPKDMRRISNKEGLDDQAIVRGVKNKLGTCIAVVEAVDTFRKDYQEIQKPKDAVGAFEDPIILNVGGERFSTSLSSLRSIKGSFFEKMFRKGANTTVGADGTYFIDRDPSSFGHILDYLRNGDLLIKSDDQSLRMKVLDDAEYYTLPTSLLDYLRWSSAEGIDLWFSEVAFLNRELKKVNRELGGLLYQASKDGYADSSFHSRCDSKGPTVVIIQTKLGTIFGGYTYTSWASSGNYAASSKAFTFRLRPTIKKFEQRSGREANAIYRSSTYGPTFGNHDILINDCQYIAQCQVSGSTYVDVGYEINDGQRYFRVEDYVVVQAKSI